MNAKQKVLIVDDEADLLEMVGFQFRAKGFEVQSAGNGLEALIKLKDFHPDLIILDINMPKMGGIEFYSKICGPDGKPLYPVLVLTARANIKELFTNLNIEGFMIKPFEIDRLIEEAQLIIQKDHFKVKFSGGIPKLCIVDHNLQTIDQLNGLFPKSNYIVSTAHSGAAALEGMMNNVPDIALVNLGLADIAGDMVILSLSQMSKTRGIKFILYTSHTEEHEPKVMERISEKTGIYIFVEYKQLKELLEVVTISLESM